MDTTFLRFIAIPIIIIVLSSLARVVRNKWVKPKTEGDVQKPGRFDGCLVKIIQGVTVFAAIFAVIGFIGGEMEMGIVFSVMALIFGGIVLLLKREYNISYQENNEYFVLNHKNQEYKVFYENIVDWIPSYNEISILDKTKEDQKYIRVNVSMVRPEILLSKIADMTFDGQFTQVNNPIDPNDPTREYELIHFLDRYNYGYLIEEQPEK